MRYNVLIDNEETRSKRKKAKQKTKTIAYKDIYATSALNVVSII